MSQPFPGDKSKIYGMKSESGGPYTLTYFSTKKESHSPSKDMIKNTNNSDFYILITVIIDGSKSH